MIEMCAPVDFVGLFFVMVLSLSPSQACLITGLKVFPSRPMTFSTLASSPSRTKRRLSGSPGSRMTSSSFLMPRTSSRTAYISPSPLDSPPTTRSLAQPGSTPSRRPRTGPHEVPLRPLAYEPDEQLEVVLVASNLRERAPASHAPESGEGVRQYRNRIGLAVGLYSPHHVAGQPVQCRRIQLGPRHVLWFGRPRLLPPYRKLHPPGEYVLQFLVQPRRDLLEA